MNTDQPPLDDLQSADLVQQPANPTPEALHDKNRFSKKSMLTSLVILSVCGLAALVGILYFKTAEKLDSISDDSTVMTATPTPDGNLQVELPDNVAMVKDNTVYFKVDGKLKNVYKLRDYEYIQKYIRINGEPTIIALHRSGTETADIIAITKDGSRTLFTNDSYDSYHFIISENGTKTLYENNEDDPNRIRPTSLIMYDFEAKTEKTVYTFDPNMQRFPRYHDWVGDTVYYSTGCRQCDGPTELNLYGINIQTGKLQTLLEPTDFPTAVREELTPAKVLIDPGGKMAIVLALSYKVYGVGPTIPSQTRAPAYIYKINLTSGEIVALTSLDEYTTDLYGLSADGLTLYYGAGDFVKTTKDDATVDATLYDGSIEGAEAYYKEGPMGLFALNTSTGESRKILLQDTNGFLNNRNFSLQFTSNGVIVNATEPQTLIKQAESKSVYSSEMYRASIADDAIGDLKLLVRSESQGYPMPAAQLLFLDE